MSYDECVCVCIFYQYIDTMSTDIQETLSEMIFPVVIAIAVADALLVKRCILSQHLSSYQWVSSHKSEQRGRDTAYVQTNIRKC